MCAWCVNVCGVHVYVCVSQEHAAKPGSILWVQRFQLGFYTRKANSFTCWASKEYISKDGTEAGDAV